MFKDKLPKDFDMLTDLQAHYLMSYSPNKEQLFMHSANLDSNFLKDLKSNVADKYELPLDTFETEKEIDDKVYIFPPKDKDGLKFSKEILDVFKITTGTIIGSNNSITTATKIPTPTNLKFIISHFKTNSGNNVLIFSRQDRIGVPNKKKAFKFNGNDDFNIVNIDDIYLFNPFPTCIFINEDIYVIDYKGFIEIFQYKQHLTTYVNDVIEMLEKSAIISNMSSYKTSFGKYRFFNALTKIDKDPNAVLKFVKSNAADIQKITTEYEVHFNYDSTQNNFHILDEEGIKILVRLLSDRTGFNLANTFIMYPSRETITRKNKKKSTKPKNKVTTTNK
ncbi:Kiwa anti-phage protein KwaB-like domain-containing protein [Lysinibacillus sp. NPDC093210]|uniref:Kiwa anti-phage protein KwaB-like domain-containing protein n=1 Tax=Lysinibacillus sp. NPDC093210 TaxID=3364133 RepID=UPI003804B9AB